MYQQNSSPIWRQWSRVVAVSLGLLVTISACEMELDPDMQDEEWDLVRQEQLIDPGGGGGGGSLSCGTGVNGDVTTPIVSGWRDTPHANRDPLELQRYDSNAGNECGTTWYVQKYQNGSWIPVLS